MVNYIQPSFVIFKKTDLVSYSTYAEGVGHICIYKDTHIHIHTPLYMPRLKVSRSDKKKCKFYCVCMCVYIHTYIHTYDFIISTIIFYQIKSIGWLFRRLDWKLKLPLTFSKEKVRKKVFVIHSQSRGLDEISVDSLVDIIRPGSTLILIIPLNHSSNVLSCI